jgi:dihydrofolate reductase
MSGFDGREREFVLGRKTYEIFEAHWPYQPADDPTAQALNAARKHVASRTLTSLAWRNSTLRLVSTLASTTGVAISTYAPAGQVPVGTFGQAEPSAKEVARRQKLARESS